MASTKIKSKVGYAGNVKEIDVELPEGEPAPWGADANLKYVGTDIRRIDGADKVTGRARYTFDVNLPNMLVAKILFSPVGAGSLVKLDLAAAAKMPGVKGVHAMKKVGDPVLHHGDELAAVAAETEEQAEEAAHAIVYEIDKLPAITTIEQALRPGARQVFPGKANVETQRSAKDNKDVDAGERDAKKAIAGAAKVIEATYDTQVQNHSSLESHGVVAKFEPDGSLTVWASTQGTFGVKGDAVEQTGLPDDKVRVLSEFVGGGFGSKFRLETAGQVALELAKKTKRPIKCMLTRAGEHVRGGNRPSSLQKMRGGVGSDGKIKGLTVETWGTAGVGGGAGCRNPAIYDFGKTYKVEHTVFTNGAPGRAFRAPGHPQGIFAVESFVDELATSIGMDPLKFRLKNIDHPFYEAQWKLAAEQIGWKEKCNPIPGRGTGTIKRGVGMASSLWYQMGGPGGEVDVTIRRDGRVIVENGAQDIGTGTKTLLAAIVGEELDIPPDQLIVKMGDTRLPKGPGSGGSVTAPTVGPAARNAGIAAKRALLEVVAKSWKCKPQELELTGGAVVNRGTGKRATFAEAAKLIPGDKLKARGVRGKNFEALAKVVGGCQFAEVEVDTETGNIRVVKVVAVQDAGRVISKLLFESQILGGVIQGLSYALHEERTLDRRSGTQVNPNFLDYKISGTVDMPEIVSIAFNVANAGNNCGMMGLGEPPKIPTAAAIANAVFNATGVRVRSLPMTPDKVLAAFAAQGGGKSKAVKTGRG